MVIVRIKPNLVISGGSVGDEAFIDFLDLENEKAYSKRWAHY
jgi:hypothetical protein